jgi:hypothetical protein
MINEEYDNLIKELNEELDRTGRVVSKDGMTTYRSIQYEGYLGDFAKEYWTDEDYKRHEENVKRLIEEGKYGRPYICELTVKDFPLFDHTSSLISKRPLESYSYELIDISNI